MTNTKTQKDFSTKRAANGTVQDLDDGQGVFRLLAPADIKMSGTSGIMVYLTVEHYDEETGKTNFLVMSQALDTHKKCGFLAYQFYASLEKGQFLFISYKASEKSNPIMSISKHEAKKAKAPAAVV